MVCLVCKSEPARKKVFTAFAFKQIGIDLGSKLELSEWWFT